MCTGSFSDTKDLCCERFSSDRAIHAGMYPFGENLVITSRCNMFTLALLHALSLSLSLSAIGSQVAGVWQVSDVDDDGGRRPTPPNGIGPEL